MLRQTGRPPGDRFCRRGIGRRCRRRHSRLAAHRKGGGNILQCRTQAMRRAGRLARSIHDRSFVSSDFARAGAFVRRLHGAGI